MSDDSSTGYAGQMGLTDPSTMFNAVDFVVRQRLARCRTMVLAQIVAVDESAGTVDVRPVVNQIDGLGNATEHGTVLGLPFMGIQGGGNAVVIVPAVDEIGVVVVSDRDISAVKASRARANPGSFRRFDLADGVYLGSVFGTAPTQQVKFTSTGMLLSDKNGNKIEMKAGSIDVTTPLFRVNGAVIAGFGGVDQVNLQTHIHPSNGAPPTPGS